ncbi:MAG: lactate racemase domain-containing protein [Acidobacteriia bacterium]|nr:lactate racemase domain-containing protein [Terriglobia bacterium]
MVVGKGFADRYLTGEEISQVVRDGLGTLAVEGKRVLVIIPDGTRTMPMPRMFDWFEAQLAPRVAALDYLVALGTHPLMSDEQLSKLLGRPVSKGRCGKSRIFNHHWEDPRTFVTLGVISAAEIGEITGGLLAQEVPVRLNKLILDYDQLIICGPVFPHEVVGFSGGTKYFFPGIAGPEIINLTHWLGALMTNYQVIGAGYTPVRAVIDRATSFIDRPSACFALVVTHEGVAGIYFGSPQEAWKTASVLSAEKHIVYVRKPFRRVLSVMPRLYDDLWTAGKGMYKMEPAVADGGEVVIFAPHISEISYTHGKVIEEIGYHCRDYFLAQWDRFKGYPWGVVAHSTHVKGLGQYDASTGRETPRVQVTLATDIPAERCRRVNLGYLDPATVQRQEWEGREEEGILVVPRAGEMLYRVKNDANSGQ